MIAVIPDIPFEISGYKLYYSNRFISDWIIGLSFCLAISFLPEFTFNVSDRFATNFRKLANFSFPLYVMHYPLLALYKSIFRGQPETAFSMLIGVSVVIIACFIIGNYFENKKPVWIRFFKQVLSADKTRLVRKPVRNTNLQSEIFEEHADKL